MEKKAQGLSLNTIIVAIIVLVVLVFLVLIFTGQITLFSGEIGKCSTKEGTCYEIAEGGCPPDTKSTSGRCADDREEDENYVCCIGLPGE
ncbi:MAG: hypothetical protein GY861_07380 [bacterium]|nr:hypothetical protein [bacterium]